MAFYIRKCNHCSADKVKFNVLSYTFDLDEYLTYFFLVCENCFMPTTIKMETSNHQILSFLKNKEFKIENQFNLDTFFYNDQIVNTPSNSLRRCPEHVPLNLKSIFDEAAICYSQSCYIACSSMLRLCLDVTTKELLAQYNTEVNENKRIDTLANRVTFLFEKQVIPNDLKALIDNIRLDGNDAVHEGSTEREEAEDLLDFSELLLERIYTMKKQIEIAQARRLTRRNK